jgi:hypothetical protein
MTPPFPTKFKITGGTKTSVTGYNVYTFTSSGSIICRANATISVLVCAGGGGGAGGSDRNIYVGGGGAGGMISKEIILSSVEETMYIAVGTGGAGGKPWDPMWSEANTVAADGKNGAPSSVTFSINVSQNLTAIGGGFGMGGLTMNTAGLGGSGGGAQGTKSPGTGTTGQGNDGAKSYATLTAGVQSGGGGGGGAGGKGGQIVTSNQYNYGSSAGPGLTCSLNGINAVTTTKLFCAGGAGKYIDAQAATSNSGNGGNSAYPNNSSGTAGASGVVYIAIPTSYSQKHN